MYNTNNTYHIVGIQTKHLLRDYVNSCAKSFWHQTSPVYDKHSLTVGRIHEFVHANATTLEEIQKVTVSPT